MSADLLEWSVQKKGGKDTPTWPAHVRFVLTETESARKYLKICTVNESRELET